MKAVRLLMLMLLLVSATSRAESDSAEVHFASHFGLSYALETFAYGLSSRGLRMERGDALLFSSVAVMVGGVLRQVLAAGQGPVGTDGIWQNALGVAASVGTSVVFEF